MVKIHEIKVATGTSWTMIVEFMWVGQSNKMFLEGWFDLIWFLMVAVDRSMLIIGREFKVCIFDWTRNDICCWKMGCGSVSVRSCTTVGERNVLNSGLCRIHAITAGYCVGNQFCSIG